MVKGKDTRGAWSNIIYSLTISLAFNHGKKGVGMLFKNLQHANLLKEQLILLNTNIANIVVKNDDNKTNSTIRAGNVNTNH